MARRELVGLARRPALHDQAQAGRRLRRRHAVHLRRCRVFAGRGVRREGRQHRRRLDARRREGPHGRGGRSGHGGHHLPGAVRPRPAAARQPADPAEAQASDARGRVGAGVHLAHELEPGRHHGARAVHDRRVRGRPAAGVRAQPALLPQGRRRRPAAARRSRRRRNRGGSERGDGAARIGPDRRLGERDPARGLRDLQAGRRRGAR